MTRFLNILLIPLAIIRVRIIQYRYRKITTANYNNQTNNNIAALRLLQSQEYYYECQFSAYGKFHPEFTFTQESIRGHIKFMEWLFPQKTFMEWPLVIWHNPRAITYYHNKIFTLKNNTSTSYEREIQMQIKKWRDAYLRSDHR